MSSLIKNQILKHLTKFFKDLAPEQLQMNALMGSCELSNLQLNEVVLMNLLEIPVWMKITAAVVDRIHIKIHWTKIKSVPIQMHLNEVTVQVEVCDEFRNIEGEKTDLSQYINTNPGKYGFVDRVIDGITVVVNSVNISFKSKLMAATFNLSRVTLESRCPNWKPGELSLTRLKDVNKGQILLFKVCEWHTMRLEAKCLTNPDQAPLRLITNYAQCQLTIKKKLEDCSVVAARIFVIFEDILWILTFAQFISASAFVEYIFSLIKRSPMSKKNDNLGNDVSNISSVGQTALITPLNTPAKPLDKVPILTGNMSSASLLEQKFRCYDIIETSLHLYIEKIDAHLYDDIESQTKANRQDVGGAIQLTLNKIQFDCYPYSRATSDRKHWYKWFDPSPSTRRQWFNSHFSQFDNLRQKRIESGMKLDSKPPAGSDEHLLSLTVLFKIKDFCMNCVATNSSTLKGGVINKFIQIDKDYQMPAEMPSLYLELDYFYYFDVTNQMMVYDDVPDPVAFVHLSPTKLLFDSPTVLFLNSFYANLSKALTNLNNLFPQDTTPPKIHARIEILMPQLSLPAKSRDKPGKSSKLLIKSGKITLSNSLYDKNVLQKLNDTILQLDKDSSSHINMSPKNLSKLDKSSVWDLSILDQAQSELSPTKQLWAFQFEPFWLDFMNYDSNEVINTSRIQPIVEPVKAYIFIHINLRSAPSDTDATQSNNKRDIISILVTLIDEPILANLDKTEFRFLQRFFAHLDKFLQQMKSDISNIIQLEHVTEDTLELHLAAYINQIMAKVLFDKHMIEIGVSGDFDEEDGEEEHKQSIPSPKEKPQVDNSLQSSSVKSSYDPYISRSEADTVSLKESSYQQPNVLTIRDDSISMQILDEDIDECAEVADDATCFLFDNQVGNSNSVSSCKKYEEKKLNDAKTNDVQVESLLSEIEESSKLFAKVKLQTSKDKPNVELEHSSYLEFSISQLILKTNALTSSSPSSNNKKSDMSEKEEQGQTMANEIQKLREENEALKEKIKLIQSSKSIS